MDCNNDFPDMQKFHKLTKIFATEVFLQQKMSHVDFITLDTIRKIMVSNKKDKIRVSEIVKYLDVPNAAVSRTLRSLENKGYIFRTIDPSDRRNIHVEITEEGKNILNQCSENITNFYLGVRERFGEKKTVQLRNLLHEFSEIWKDELKNYNKERQ